MLLSQAVEQQPAHVKERLSMERTAEEMEGKDLTLQALQARQDTVLEKTLLPFGEYLQTLLNYQLEKHEALLKRVFRKFRKLNVKRNGIIDRPKFIKLVEAVDSEKTESQIETYLRAIDPHNLDHIAFSECVNFLHDNLRANVDAEDESEEDEPEADEDAEGEGEVEGEEEEEEPDD